MRGDLCYGRSAAHAVHLKGFVHAKPVSCAGRGILGEDGGALTRHALNVCATTWLRRGEGQNGRRCSFCCPFSSLHLSLSLSAPAPGPPLQAGTIYYMAPEVMQKQPHTKQCDMWGMGVLLFMMLSGAFWWCVVKCAVLPCCFSA